MFKYFICSQVCNNTFKMTNYKFVWKTSIRLNILHVCKILTDLIFLINTLVLSQWFAAILKHFIWCVWFSTSSIKIHLLF